MDFELPLWTVEHARGMTCSVTRGQRVQTFYRHVRPSLAERTGGSDLSERLHLFTERFNVPPWKEQPKITSPDNKSSESAWNWTCQHAPPSSRPLEGSAFSTLLSNCEGRIIRVIQMYPQGTGGGSVTAVLWWWGGSVRGCDGESYTVLHFITVRARTWSFPLQLRLEIRLMRRGNVARGKNSRFKKTVKSEARKNQNQNKPNAL